jgi:carboxyl-terminal processing protease
MRLLRGAVLAASVAVAACSDSTGPSSSMSASASSYLNQALDFEQAVFLFGKQINWPAMRADVMKQAGNAQTTAATYDAIEYSIEHYFRPLGDPHSAFWPPSDAPGRTDSPSNPAYLVSGTTITPAIAYLWMPTFSGRNPIGRADSTLTVIRALDASKPCGWIMDLRFNPGGTWASMIAGINPLLGNGTFGGLVDADSARLNFYVQNGEAGIIDPSTNLRYPQVRSSSTYTLSRPNAPVAILQGANTASAGELIILAFRGSATPMKTFGASTYGLTTTPSGIYLRPDSAYLNITSAVMFDRTGKIYGSKIVPDQQTTFPSPLTIGARDETVNAAIAWLQAQPSCAGSSVDLDRAPRAVENAVLPGKPSPNARPDLVSRYFLRQTGGH